MTEFDFPCAVIATFSRWNIFGSGVPQYCAPGLAFFCNLKFTCTVPFLIVLVLIYEIVRNYERSASES